MIDIEVWQHDALWMVATGFARRSADDPEVLELTADGAAWTRAWMRNRLYAEWSRRLYGATP